MTALPPPVLEPHPVPRKGQMREGAWVAVILGPLGLLLAPWVALGGMLGLCAVIAGGIVVSQTSKVQRAYRIAATIGIATGGLALLAGLFH